MHNEVLHKTRLEVYITQDGSPTLSFAREDEYTEKMHHSSGAWTETAYIYLPAIELASKAAEQPHLLSMGLGLGYNEMMACAFEMTSKKPFIIHSFELLPTLRTQFEDFIQHRECKMFEEVYEKVLQFISAHFNLSPADLRKYTQSKIDKGELKLFGPFPAELPKDFKYHGLLYDAFSNKMNPELWSEDFLKDIFERITAKDCVLSTYAATGAIKRALLSLGFQKKLRPGFSGKRDSSFYLRGSLAEK